MAVELKLLEVDKIIVKERQREDASLELNLLVDSIRRVGLIHPILVDNYNNLWAGERRLLAFKKLGRTHIYAWTGDDWELIELIGVEKLRKAEAEREENITRLDFKWPEVARMEKKIFLMQKEIDPKWSNRKQAEAKKLSRGTIDKRIELADALELMPELEEFATEDEAVKELSKLEEKKAVAAKRIKLPDYVRNAPKWAQDHYVIGNALELIKEVPPKSVDFVEVDSPYAVDLIKVKSRHKTDNLKNYTEWTLDQYKLNFQEVAVECYRAMKDNTFGVFWYGTMHHESTLNMLIGAGFAVNPVNAIWYKGDSGQTQQADVSLASCYEPFFLVRKGKPKLNRQGRGNVFHYQTLAPGKKRHATEKPLSLMEDILDTICRLGSRIMVPFLGSGVTLLAAYNLEMTGFGWDLDKENREKFLEAVEKREEMLKAEQQETAVEDEPDAERRGSRKTS